MIGGLGSDTLVSRSGRDALWGGNQFSYIPCENISFGGNTDAADNENCLPYLDQAICGLYDNNDIQAASFCCQCGGGSDGTQITITSENTSTDLSATMF